MEKRNAIPVFVVEDQPAIRKALLKYLATREEVEVLGCAPSGELGLEALAELGEGGRPEVLVLDLELPGIDGIGVLEAVRERWPEVRVLILTTFDDEAKVYEAVNKGASGYLVKRIATEKVVEAICEVADGGVVIESRIAKRFWNYFESVKATPKVPDRGGLSELELEVLHYIARGLSNAEVGEVMDIERRTVRTHLSHIYEKLGVSSHVSAVVEGLKRGLINL
ncbi:MAG: response regulator transcription factor [Deltaproteobacteria bacterium]|nr:response regulator transcription factor [Deltaproteobacteria bacterium]